jgi:hypothetical protein
MQGLGRPSDQECLQIMLAFFRINDLGQRRGLIALAEWFAASPGPAFGETSRGKPSPIVQDNRRQTRRRT